MVPGTPVRRRTAWLVATVFAVLVFVVFVAGTTYSVLAPGYVFEPGEPAADAAVLIGAACFAALGVYRLRVLDRRISAAAAEYDFSAWLPPAHGLPADTAQLRRTARRAAVFVPVWLVVFAAGVTGLELLDAAAAGLLATGVREPGVVLAVHDPAKGTPTIDVGYGTQTVEIARDSGRDYRVGDQVTVVHDGEHVRTTEERNENQYLFGFSMVSLLLGLGALPFSIGAAVGWRRRARAVGLTGWRSAEVTVDALVQRAPDVRVRYRDGTRIALRGVLSTRRFRTPGRRRAWIGGWGRHMVVFFPDDRRLVPVSARTLRDPAGLSRSRP